MKEYFCILGGGGIRGAAYSGALKALFDNDIKITGWGGSSVGAVVAGFVVCGYSPEAIQECFENIDFTIFKDINFDFKKGLALSKGGNFYEWMKEKIGSRCFADLDVELVIYACDIANSKFYEFSKKETPNVEIAHAIRVSVGMPGLYAPVYDNDECLIDGDLLKSIPLWAVSSTVNSKKERILEFRLEDNENKKKITSTIDYLNAVYDTMTGFATDYIIDKYKNCDKYDFIKINLKDISVADFMLNNEKKSEIVKKGYDVTANYFKNEYPKKALVLNRVYSNIYENFQKTTFLLKNKEFNAARYEIADIFEIIAKEKEILDTDFIEKFAEFKKSYNTGFILKKGIFGKKPVLVNNDGIIEKAQEINSLLLSKINYFS